MHLESVANFGRQDARQDAALHGRREACRYSEIVKGCLILEGYLG
jgi:hypothetical protein